MDDRSNVQLNQRKITFQVGLQERTTDQSAGIQRKYVHGPPALLDRRDNAFVAVVRCQVCLEPGDSRAVGA
jgi:hypothetical protein